MIKRILFIVAFLYLSVALYADAPLRRFENWFQQFKRGQVELASLPGDLTSLHFVFLTGLGGRKSKEYFLPVIRQLRALGVSRQQLHVIRNPSRKGFFENAEEINKQLDTIVDRYGISVESLVLMAHSRAGLELWTSLSRRPAFVRRYVRKAYFLQVPYGGIPIAERIENRQTIGGWDLLWQDYLSAFYLLPLRLMEMPLHRQLRAAITMVSPNNVRAHFEKLEREFSTVTNEHIASKKFVVVGTYRNKLTDFPFFSPKELLLRGCAARSSAMRGSSLRHDGLLFLDDAFPPEIESSRVVLSGCDHLSIVMGRCGRAFAKAVLASL